eukprot:542250-Hanusia_phi.AAC.2
MTEADPGGPSTPRRCTPHWRWQPTNIHKNCLVVPPVLGPLPLINLMTLAVTYLTATRVWRGGVVEEGEEEGAGKEEEEEEETCRFEHGLAMTKNKMCKA